MGYESVRYLGASRLTETDETETGALLPHCFLLTYLPAAVPCWWIFRVEGSKAHAGPFRIVLQWEISLGSLEQTAALGGHYS